MGRSRLALVILAVVGWGATIAAQLVAALTNTESERIEWTERRNLFLLVSSLATNTLALRAAYRLLRDRTGDRRSTATRYRR